MSNQITKMIFVRDSKTGHYKRNDSYDADDELILLSWYFADCVRFDPAHFSTIKKLILEGIVGCNDVGATIIDGKFQFCHQLIDGFKEARLTQEELLELVQKWYELISAKVDKIVLINDNGKYSIETE